MPISTSPHGSWKSPITPESLARASVQLSQLQVARERLWWIESRPTENGRNVILSCPPEGGLPREEIPSSMNARNRVNEYGSGCYCVGEKALWFTHDGDQRIYRVQDDEALAITPPGGDSPPRYCDLQLSPDERWIICQRERHFLPTGETLNELVILLADGSAEPHILSTGRDFYGALRLRPDGRALAFIAWDHPLMPWDGCELFVAEFSPEGRLGQAHLVAGNATTSVVDPSWSPNGQLYYVSDEDGWWNLHGVVDGESVNLCPMAAEFGSPPWAFWYSMHAHLRNHLLATVYIKDGQEHLGLLRPGTIAIEDLDLPFSSFGQGGELRSDGEETLFVIASTPTKSPAIYTIYPDEDRIEELYRPPSEDPDPSYLSIPRHLSFSTGENEASHALYYPPVNADFAAPEDERPPLLVMCHGGPTAAATTTLNLKVQFWTSRGFAVLDVNYRGSSGYGRVYREAIKQRSGVVEPQDCLAAARNAVERDLADPARMAIRGGSAGGYVVLCCAVFRDRLETVLGEASYFSAGTSLYGISDIEALVRTTHKFESHYPFSLVAPYPENEQVYYDRSPLHFVRQSCFPLLLMQGTEDPVVPPDQAREMVEQLRLAKRPFSYFEFEGEGHGFRRSDSVIRAFETELSFYARIFGLDLPGHEPPIV